MSARKSFAVVALFATIGLLTGILVASAQWTGPTQPPPAGNRTLVDGTGAAGQVSLWQDADTLQGDAGLTYATGTDQLTVGGSNDTILRLDGNGAGAITEFRVGADSALMIRANGADSLRLLGNAVRLYGALANCGAGGTLTTNASGDLFCDPDADSGATLQVFQTMNAPAGTDPVADSSTDTLNFTVAGGITLTGDSTTDTLAFGVNTATIQSRVTGNCNGQVVVSVNVDGTVNCEADDTSSQNVFTTMNAPSGTDPVADAAADILNFTAGAGLSISGDSTSDTLTFTNTGDTDGSNDVTTVTGTSPIVSSGGTSPAISLSSTGCSSGEVWTWTGAAWSCNPVTAAGDNLGNHIATQNLSMNGFDIRDGALAGYTPGLWDDTNDIYFQWGSPLSIRIDATTLPLYVTTARVGIGIAAPSYKLHVEYAAGEAGIAAIGPTGNTHLPYSNGWNYISGNGVIFRDTADVERMRYEAASGELGIGTTGPTHALTVMEQVRFDYPGTVYDVWIQGGAATAVGDARNLALLGEETTDRLRLNIANEYSAGTMIEGYVTINRAAAIVRPLEVYLNAAAGTSVFAVHSQLGNSMARITTDGMVYGAGFFYNSDRRLKDNIAPLDDSLSKILQLQGVRYNWKNTGQVGIGLIAQDVERVFPEVVTNNTEDGSEGIKTVDYGHLVGPMVEAIKEQQVQIEELRAEVAQLKTSQENSVLGYCPAW